MLAFGFTFFCAGRSNCIINNFRMTKCGNLLISGIATTVTFASVVCFATRFGASRIFFIMMFNVVTKRRYIGLCNDNRVANRAMFPLCKSCGSTSSGNCRIGGGSPWTKDGSKADLTLNLYARELAVKAAHKYQKTVTASLACCIGRKDVEVSIYDENGKTLEEYHQSVTPAELTERYGLKRPIFADLCRCGLFTYPGEWNKIAIR